MLLRLAAAALLMLTGCRSHQPPGKFDPKDIHGYVTRLNRSDHPEAKRIRQELANGAANLAKQRALARAEGIPLTPAELKRPKVPPAQNAGHLYQQLDQLLKANPINGYGPTGKSQIETSMGPGKIYTPADIKAAQIHLAERQDVMNLIYRATDLPECDF